MLREASIEFLQGSPALEAIMVADDGLLEMVAKSCPVLLKELWVYEDDSIHNELLMWLWEYGNVMWLYREAGGDYIGQPLTLLDQTQSMQKKVSCAPEKQIKLMRL